MALQYAKRTLTSSDIINGGFPLRDVTPFFIEVVNSTGKPQPLYMDDLPVPDNLYSVKLLINPANITINMSKIINRTQTMVGWVEDHWGEEIDTLSLQGKSAAFVTGGTTLWGTRDGNSDKKLFEETATVRRPYNEALQINDLRPEIPTYGLTTQYRSNALAYHQFKRIVEAVRQNGAYYSTDNFGFVSDRYYVRLRTDIGTFDGYIETMDMQENADSPFNFSYQMTFKSEKTVLTYLR